jgi:hypothetical protein
MPPQFGHPSLSGNLTPLAVNQESISSLSMDLGSYRPVKTMRFSEKSLVFSLK